MQGRYLLVGLFVHWVLTLITAIVGLSATEPPVAAAYEYEPLGGDNA